MIKKLGFIIFIILLFRFSFTTVNAADISVTCDSEGPCALDPTPGTLFNDSAYLPGQSIARKISIVNNDIDDSCNLYIDTVNETDNAGISAKVFTALSDGTSDLYGERDGQGNAGGTRTLRTLYDAGSIFLTDLPASSSKAISWVVTFDPQTTDEYQGTTVSFDFDLQFTCGTLPAPTEVPPTATPAPADDTASPTSTPTPTPASLSPLGGFFPLTGFSAFEPLTSLEELTNLEALPTPTGFILGTGANTSVSGMSCRTLPIWPGIIVAQIGASLFLLSRLYKLKLGSLSAGLLASFLIATGLIINLSCTLLIVPLWWASSVLLASFTGLLRLRSSGYSRPVLYC